MYQFLWNVRLSRTKSGTDPLLTSGSCPQPLAVTLVISMNNNLSWFIVGCLGISSSPPRHSISGFPTRFPSPCRCVISSLDTKWQEPVFRLFSRSYSRPVCNEFSEQSQWRHSDSRDVAKNAPINACIWKYGARDSVRKEENMEEISLENKIGNYKKKPIRNKVEAKRNWIKRNEW
jgi:hypothetical protein